MSVQPAILVFHPYQDLEVAPLGPTYADLESWTYTQLEEQILAEAAYTYTWCLRQTAYAACSRELVHVAGSRGLVFVMEAHA
jgi:hypothetical protein